jgi:hypothetical protein
VDQVHSAELELAIVNLVRDAGGIAWDDATVHVARLYGWTRRGPDISRRLGATLDHLVAAGQLARIGDELKLSDR